MQRSFLFLPLVLALFSCADGTMPNAQDPAGAPAPGLAAAQSSPAGVAGRAEARAVSPLQKVLDELGRRSGRGSITREDGQLLRILTESIGAQHVVEIGSLHGHSAIWICLGLKATGGKLTAYEIDPDNIKTARTNFERAGVSTLVTMVEGDAHQEITKSAEPIDLVFIDADKEGYLDYLEKLRTRVRPGGLILAHNMNFPRPDPRFVAAITEDPDFETVFFNMDGPGMSVTLKKH